MSSSARKLASGLAVVLASCCLAAPALARWPDGGYPVTATSRSESLATVVSLPGQGEVGPAPGSELVCWSASPSSGPAVCWALVWAGSSSWAPETLVTLPGGSLSRPVAAITGTWSWPVSDLPGAVMVAWRESRGGTSTVRARQLLGLPGTFPDTGVVVTHRTIDDGSLMVCGDQYCGGIVSWIDRRTGEPLLYAQRYDLNGVAQWTADGVCVAPMSLPQSDPCIVPDYWGGGALFAWLEGAIENTDMEVLTAIAAQHLGADGQRVAGWGVTGNVMSLT